LHNVNNTTDELRTLERVTLEFWQQLARWQ